MALDPRLTRLDATRVRVDNGRGIDTVLFANEQVPVETSAVTELLELLDLQESVEQVAKLRYPNLPDETVVELPLAEPVEPGSTVEISFKFTAQLPEVFARTGYKGDFNLVGQWYPKIGVRVGPPGAERWECQPLHLHTEFFADFGNYDVTLTVPSTHVVAATGLILKRGPDLRGVLAALDGPRLVAR